MMSEDNLTYHKVLDKNKPIYLAWDNLFTGSQSPSAADTRVFNAFISKLKAAGLNIVRTKQGPNQLYQNMNYLYKNCIKDAIIINCMNGVDPANIKEVPKFPESAYTNKIFCSNNALKSANVNGLKSGEAKAGAITRYNNNDVVLGWFRSAADCCNKGGRGVTRGIIDRTSNLAYQGRFYHPEQYMKQHEIIGLCSSSDEGTRTGDPDGLKLADMIIDLFKPEGDTPSETPSSTTSTTPSDSEKTLSKKVVKNVYKVPWYEKILTTKTDNNGAFLVKQPSDMNIKGEYLVNLYFAGDSTYESCNKSIRIQKFSGRVEKDELLENVVTEYYTDGTNQETLHSGSVPDDKTIKTKTVNTTYTYENGVVKSTIVNTIYNYKVIEIAETPNIIDTTTNVNPIENNTPTVNDGNTADPFSNDIALLNGGAPNVNAMSTNGKRYVMYDENKSYTLTLDQFHEVYYRDSKSLQLNNYKVSKYTAFQSTDTQTYNVIPRLRWNPVVQAVHHWLVRHNGTSWFSNITIDFAGKKVVINGQSIAFTGKESQYHVVVDYQDNASKDYGTCGPTSCSMTTQWLYRYISEAKLKRDTGHGKGGIGPQQCVSGLNKNGFRARNISGLNNWRSTLEQGKGLVFHLSNHYVCFFNIVGNYVYCANPVPTFKLARGWQNVNTANGRGIGGHTAVELNWTISEAEKQRIQHFYKSMGGSWTINANTGITLPVVKTGR